MIIPTRNHLISPFFSYFLYCGSIQLRYCTLFLSAVSLPLILLYYKTAPLSSRLPCSSPAFQHFRVVKDIPDDFVSIDISFIIIKLTPADRIAVGYAFPAFICNLQKKSGQPYIRPNNLPDYIFSPNFTPHNIMFKYQPEIFIPDACAAAERIRVDFSPAHTS